MKKEKKNNINRRKFILSGSLATAAGFVSLTGFKNKEIVSQDNLTDINIDTETLYNGIKLPKNWPPKDLKPNCYDPMPVPYLASPPEVIPIDIGRQLFVDDFLIEYTDSKRKFHQPEKYQNNPVLKPQIKVEMNSGFYPSAAPFSDGCFYDPKDNLFKVWYQAGWFDGTALATSKDGINWERPEFDVVRGTNLVLDPKKDLGEERRRDGVSVWLDHDAKNSEERYKMYWWGRKGQSGGKLLNGPGHLLTSSDGIHWKWQGEIGKTGDNSTFFYNPFRKKWCFTVRRQPRPAPPWAYGENGRTRGRARSYWESSDYFAALGAWKGYEPVFWFGADRYDHKRKNYEIGDAPQIYKVDAVGYESLMLGLIQTHYGSHNNECAKDGFPKLTELQLAFSRDGLVKTLLKLDKAINENAISAVLKGLGQAGARKLQMMLLPKNADWLAKSGLKSITLDADSTVKSVCGSQKGTVKGYNTTKKGVKSYHPLLVFVSEMKLLYHTWFSTGSAYTSNGIVDFLKEVKASLPKTVEKVFPCR